MPVSELPDKKLDLDTTTSGQAHPRADRQSPGTHLAIRLTVEAQCLH